MVKEIKENQHQCENTWNGSSNAHLSDGIEEVGVVQCVLKHCIRGGEGGGVERGWLLLSH